MLAPCRMFKPASHGITSTPNRPVCRSDTLGSRLSAAGISGIDPRLLPRRTDCLPGRAHAVHAAERAREVRDRSPRVYQVAIEAVLQHFVRVAIECPATSATLLRPAETRDSGSRQRLRAWHCRERRTRRRRRGCQHRRQPSAQRYADEYTREERRYHGLCSAHAVLRAGLYCDAHSNRAIRWPTLFHRSADAT